MLLLVLISGVRTPTLEKVFYKYFNHLEVFSNKSIYFLNQYWIIFVSDVTETSKEVLAGLKMLLTFLSPAASPSQFYFFRIKVTLLYSSYFCQKKKKKITKIFFKKLWLTIFCNIRYKASKLCQTLSKNGNCSIFTKNVEKRWQYFGDMTFRNR